MTIRMDDPTDPSSGCTSKLTLDADISTAKWSESLCEWIFVIQTRALQVGEECFTTCPHLLDDRMINAEVQASLTWLDDS